LNEAGGNIMADRGCDIQAQLTSLDAHLNMPPFRNGSWLANPRTG